MFAVKYGASPLVAVFAAHLPKFDGTLISYVRGQQVVGEGDPTDNFFLVVSGLFRGVRTTADGRRQVFAFYVAGDLCGLEDDGRHKLAVEPVDAATMAILPRLACRQGMNEEPKINAALFEGVTRALALTIDHMMMVGRGSAEERLAWFLVRLAAASDGADIPVVDLAMRRQDIADYLGLTIETISRTLGLFRGNGLIEVHKLHRVKILRPEALARLAAADCDTAPILDLTPSKPRTH